MDSIIYSIYTIERSELISVILRIACTLAGCLAGTQSHHSDEPYSYFSIVINITVTFLKRKNLLSADAINCSARQLCGVRICVVHFIHSVLPLAMGCCKISLPKMKRTSVLFFSYRVNCTLHDLSYQKYPHFVIGCVCGLRV